jgi:hypothetical protein
MGGLRPNSPVTCGFSTLHPALSRRPRAIGAEPPGSLDERELAQGARPQPAAFEGVQFVPVLTSFARRAGMLRQASAGIACRRAVRDRTASPSRCLCRRSVSVRLEPPGRACPPSSPSSPPMRCPGSGIQRSGCLSASKPLRPPWRLRGATASSHPAGGGEPASAAAATCWRGKCRDVAISTRTKAPEGLESCRRGGAS